MQDATLRTRSSSAPRPSDRLAENWGCVIARVHIRASRRFLSSHIFFLTTAMSKEQKLLNYVLEQPDLESIRGNPEAVLKLIDEYVKENPMMIIGRYKGEVVLEQIRKIEPSIMIELGCYVGYSAILFGSEIARQNKLLSSNSRQGKYYSFELSEEFADIARQMIDLAGLSQTVEITVGAAGSTIPDFQSRITAEQGKFTAADIVFIDHEKSLYVADLRVIESSSLIAPGTVILADNIYWPGAPDYVKYVQGTPEERNIHNKNNPNVSNEKLQGRWNILYESNTVPVNNPENGLKDAVEVTKCTSYLSG